MIVVDLGCETQMTDRSIEPLVERFAPDLLLGFDPAATPPLQSVVSGTHVVVERKAAWVEDGTVEFSARTGIEGTLMTDSNAWTGHAETVQCFDFSEWVRALDTRDVIVKMDIEGAEVPVLEKLVADGTDALIGLLLVEWHDWLFGDDFAERRAKVEAMLRCPVEVWH